MRITIYCLLMLFGAGLCAHSQNSVVYTFSEFAQREKISVQPEYQSLLQSGLNQFRRSDYEGAGESFARACMAARYHPLPHFYLTASLFALQDYSAAGEILQRTVNLYPSWHSFTVDFTSFYAPDFEYFHKLTAFEKWLFASTRSTHCYFLFAFLCQFSGAGQKAEMAYKLLLTKDPSYLEVQPFLEMLTGKKESVFVPEQQKLIEQAKKHLQNENYQDAVDSWGAIYIYYPHHPEVLYALAHSLCAAGYFSHGVEILRKALNLAPDYFVSPFNSKDLFGPSRNFDKMLHEVEKHLQQQPDSHELLFLLSHFYLIINEKSKARVALEYLKKSHPHDTEIAFLWDRLAKEPPPALVPKSTPPPPSPKTPPQKLQEDVPTPMPTNKSKEKGKAAFKAEKYKEAARYFAQAIAKAPQDLENQWLLALATFATGQYQFTCNILKKVLQLSSQKREAAVWPQYYRAPELYAKHFKNLAEWVKDHPEDYEALFVYGYLLFTAGHAKQALAVFEHLRKHWKKDANVLFFYHVLKVK